LSFILMVDAFVPENGATRFAPGSHREPPGRLEIPACGSAGSLIAYNGSVLHEHGANLTDRPRRSIQGAFIRRTLPAATDWTARVRAETRARLSPLALYLLGMR
jgi:ectoine hydroxylase-related dioxygenase (phytanoyl-CoA dioxygenase family)